MLQSVVMFWAVFLLSLCSVYAKIEVIDQFSSVVDSFYNQEYIPFTDIIEGFIELANPSDACDKMTSPTFPANFTLNKIVLISDNNCSFVSKICSAEMVGYDAVVMFRTPSYSSDFDQLISKTDIKTRKGKFNGCLLNIPVVLIDVDDGIVLKNNYLYSHSSKQNFLIRITPDTQSWIIRGLLSLAVWAVPVLLLSFCCAIMRYLKEKFWSWRQKRFTEARTALGRLRRLFPTVKYSKGDPYDTCIICLCDFTIGEKLRVLGCMHAYHPHCIDAWVVNHRRRCPMCNRKVLLGDSFDNLDTDPTENTPLLSSTQTHGSYSSQVLPPLPNDVGVMSNAPDRAHSSQNSLPSVGQSTELLPSQEGSVNHAIQPDIEPGSDLPSDNRHGFIV